MEQGSEERQLADRLSSYADAVAAVAFVNALAFSVAIADQEVRCSLVHLRVLVASSSVALHAAYFTAILLFRRGELRLRRSTGSTSRELVGSYRGRLHIARLSFIILLGATSFIVVWYGLPDPSCAE